MINCKAQYLQFHHFISICKHNVIIFRTKLRLVGIYCKRNTKLAPPLKYTVHSNTNLSFPGTTTAEFQRNDKYVLFRLPSRSTIAKKSEQQFKQSSLSELSADTNGKCNFVWRQQVSTVWRTSLLRNKSITCANLLPNIYRINCCEQTKELVNVFSHVETSSNH